MKVLILCRSLDVGGTERQIVILAHGLQERGHDVAVAVFYNGAPLERELHERRIPVINLGKSGRWDVARFVLHTWRGVRTFQPDVLYAFLGTPNILAVLLKPFVRTKIVWGVRASNMDLDRYDWLFRLSYRVECRLSRFADVVISNSQAGLNYALKHGFPREKAVVVPNGIDTARFQPDPIGRRRVRRELNIADEEILIGLVARMDPMKDHPTFLRAAALLAQERPDVRFVCVGEGSPRYERELRRLASDLGLDTRLIWTGARHDIPALCNALDVACSSSYTEGFSNTIAEAMACGVPCVVTDVGDSAVIVGETGAIVPPSSPEQLRDGFRAMIGRLGPEIRSAARRSIVQRFTCDAMVDGTLSLLWSMR